MKRTLALLLGLWFCCAMGVFGQVTAIKAGRLVDPQAGAVLNDQIILIRDNKIEKVGGGIAIPADAKIIDLSQMTVLPGLIDCHTHLADVFDPNGDPFEALKKTAAETAFESVPNPRIFLREGFTTVRDVGVYRALNDVAMRDAIAGGYIEGPRMYVAGAYVTITGGAGAMTGFRARHHACPGTFATGRPTVRGRFGRGVRQLVHDGADHIKVLSSGAVLTHGSNPKSQEFTLEELQAAVDEASHFGLRVEAHAHSAEGIKNAIRAGVASVEHATMIDDEGIALAKQHGTYLDMDIYDEECIQEAGRLGKIPKDFLQHDAELGELHRQNFRKAVKAGVKLSFGTDAGVCPYDRSVRQFAFMVKYGMTAMQAIQAATTAAADLLGHSDLVGSIAPGRYADVIAVAGDPLQDISVLEHVQFVMKDGKVYKQ